MTLRHLFGLRPLAGFSDHRSPITSLCNCGFSTWPGGTVTGAPGHNAARRVLADRVKGGNGRPEIASRLRGHHCCRRASSTDTAGSG